MNRYRCHKIVQAGKISHICPSEDQRDKSIVIWLGTGDTSEAHRVSLEWMHKHKPEVGGYFVVYDDNYASYSPAAAFEAGYFLMPAVNPIEPITQRLIDRMATLGAVGRPLTPEEVREVEKAFVIYHQGLHELIAMAK
jgi:hypothetical protein